MLDLSAAPKRIQELMDEGHAIDEAVVEAEQAGLEVKLWFQVDRVEFGWQDNKNGIDNGSLVDDVIGLEFYHAATKTRWFARFSGYDSEKVEVFGLVNSWEV
jgi:hypothetical protein